mgnify:CR=1 FL=1|jgi:LysR family carnitine catabolism transcriptional activator
MNISYRNLQAFVYVAQSNSFAEAADKLHLTQPALSSAIKKLEEQIGGSLFIRSTRRVSLTPEGRVFLPHALRVLRDWDDALSDIQTLFAMEKGQLTIAAMPSFAESHLPSLLATYHSLAPNINIRIVDVVMENVIDEVKKGRADIGFTFEPMAADGLDFVPLFNDQFVAVVNPHHPLAVHTSIEWAQCIAHSFVMMNRGSAVRRWTQEKLEQCGVINIVAETGQLATLGRLICQGLGMSIMPSICKLQMESIGLKTLAIIDAPLIKKVGLVKSTQRGMSVAAKQLWQQSVDMYKKD